MAILREYALKLLPFSYCIRMISLKLLLIKLRHVRMVILMLVPLSGFRWAASNKLYNVNDLTIAASIKLLYVNDLTIKAQLSLSCFMWMIWLNMFPFSCFRWMISLMLLPLGGYMWIISLKLILISCFMISLMSLLYVNDLTKAAALTVTVRVPTWTVYL